MGKFPSLIIINTYCLVIKDIWIIDYIQKGNMGGIIFQKEIETWKKKCYNYLVRHGDFDIVCK